MESDWKSRPNGGGSEILKEYAERGGPINLTFLCKRLTALCINPVIDCDSFYFYISYTIDYGYAICFSYMSSILMPVILDVVVPLNESRPKGAVFKAEYYFDENKYFTLLFIDNFLVAFITAQLITALDSIWSIQLHYACGIFAELS